MSFFIGLLTGLIIGWNFLPQPEWVANIIANIKSKFKKDDTTPPAV